MYFNDSQQITAKLKPGISVLLSDFLLQPSTDNSITSLIVPESERSSSKFCLCNTIDI